MVGKQDSPEHSQSTVKGVDQKYREEHRGRGPARVSQPSCPGILWSSAKTQKTLKEEIKTFTVESHLLMILITHHTVLSSNFCFRQKD